MLSSVWFRLSQLEMGGARIWIQAVGRTSRAKLIITLYWHHLSWLKCAIHSIPFLCLCIFFQLTFTLYNMKIFLCKCTEMHIVILAHYITFHCMDSTYWWFIYEPSFAGHWGYFHFLLFTHTDKSLWVYLHTRPIISLL